jgi:hypothetical protein
MGTALVIGVGSENGWGGAVCRRFAREFGKLGLQVGHIVIDGVIDGDQVNTRLPQVKQNLGEEGMLQPDDIAEAYCDVAQPAPKRLDSRTRSSPRSRILLV